MKYSKEELKEMAKEFNISNDKGTKQSLIMMMQMFTALHPTTIINKINELAEGK